MSAFPIVNNGAMSISAAGRHSRPNMTSSFDSFTLILQGQPLELFFCLLAFRTNSTSRFPMQKAHWNFGEGNVILYKIFIDQTPKRASSRRSESFEHSIMKIGWACVRPAKLKKLSKALFHVCAERFLHRKRILIKLGTFGKNADQPYRHVAYTRSIRWLVLLLLLRLIAALRQSSNS